MSAKACLNVDTKRDGSNIRKDPREFQTSLDTQSIDKRDSCLLSKEQRGWMGRRAPPSLGSGGQPAWLSLVDFGFVWRLAASSPQSGIGRGGWS